MREPERESVAGTGGGGRALAALSVGQRHRDAAKRKTRGERAWCARAALQPLLQEVPHSRGRGEGEGGETDAASVQFARRADQFTAQGDQQRRRGARVQRHLQGVAQLGVELRLGPARQAGKQRGVRRGGDRQHLRRALHQAEE